MANFPITSAQIVGLFVESVFWGFHLVTAAYCMAALLLTARGSRWKSTRDINWPMLCVSLVLLGIASFDVCLGFYHNLKAFVFFTGDGGAIEEFSNISDWVNISKTLTVVLQTMIGDAMLIYRCFIIYHRSWLTVAFSIALWLGTCAMGIWIMFLEGTLNAHVLIVSSQIVPIGTSFWALTIALNIITTSLIIYKIRRVDSENRKYRLNTGKPDRPYQSRLQHVTRSIIESGVLYSIAAFTTFITFVLGNNGVYVTSDAEVQIVGIAFNLIIIRASKIMNEVEGTSLGPLPDQSLPLQIVRNQHLKAQYSSAEETQVHVLVTQNSLHDSEFPKAV